TNTIYPLASISKPITATGLMVLVERGQVDLDLPINTYLGPAKLTGLAGDARGATVRRVLSHTAGLPLHSQFFYSDRGYAPPDMAETIRRYGKLVFPPGQVVEYSNLGYGIIGNVIEPVSGKSYAEVMRQEVCVSLGFTRTSVDRPIELENFGAERWNAGGDGADGPLSGDEYRCCGARQHQHPTRRDDAGVHYCAAGCRRRDAGPGAGTTGTAVPAWTAHVGCEPGTRWRMAGDLANLRRGGPNAVADQHGRDHRSMDRRPAGRFGQQRQLLRWSTVRHVRRADPDQ